MPPGLPGSRVERLSNLAPQAEDGVALLRHVMEEARTAYPRRCADGAA